MYRAVPQTGVDDIMIGGAVHKNTLVLTIYNTRNYLLCT